MKKWYFSKNGKISGPFELDEAKDFLIKDPDFYGWHPSFNQWRPVSCIVEFNDVVPTPVPAAQIPPELIKEFVDKKQNLHDKIDNIDEKIDLSTTSIYEFEQEIKIYKRITQNLSDEVKDNIKSIEQNYNGLQKTLAELKKATDIANNEIDEIVTDFDSRVAGKSEKKTPQTQASTAVNQASEEKLVNKMKLVPAAETEASPEENVAPIQASNESKSFGSKLKSVFNIDDATKTGQQGEDLDDALADLVASEDGDLSGAEEEENKASRMRRRRRRR
ncbi:MAG: DUF4339 domain-containing protein [Colwellia sp.]|nr:DUF4339 domain-containing protein [Colwellia sp.]